MIKTIIFESNYTVKKLFNLFSRFYVTEQYMSIIRYHAKEIYAKYNLASLGYTEENVVDIFNYHSIFILVKMVLSCLFIRITDSSIHMFLVNLPYIQNISDIMCNNRTVYEELNEKLICINNEEKLYVQQDLEYDIHKLFNLLMDSSYNYNKNDFNCLIMELVNMIHGQFKHKEYCSLRIEFFNNDLDPVVFLGVNGQ